MTTAIEPTTDRTAPAYLRGLLLRSNVAVEEAVLRIYERQTADEQSTESTKEHNGVGFNGVDAPILTSFAKQILGDAARERPYGKGRRLSQRQMAIARRKIVRYVRQLSEVAQAKAAAQPRPYSCPVCGGGAPADDWSGPCSAECNYAWTHSETEDDPRERGW